MMFTEVYDVGGPQYVGPTIFSLAHNSDVISRRNQ